MPKNTIHPIMIFMTEWPA